MSEDIDLATAQRLVRRAVDKAEQLGISGAVAVVGASGALVTASRMDEGGAGGMGRARSKAWIAATQKIPSTEHLHRMTSIAPPVAAGFASISPEAAFPGAGGMPIRDAAGRIVGGIAASGSTVSPFFPAGMDRALTIVDGLPANPEDQVIAYALEVPYEGQHGDDLPRWEQAYGAWEDSPVVDAPVPSRASQQGVLDRCRRLTDAVLALAVERNLPVAVAVTDRRGEPVQQDASDSAPAGAAYVAEAVAATSALLGSASGDVADRIEAVRHVLPVPVTGLDGGVPLIFDARVWGGLGVAGPTPAQSHDLAVTAIMTTT
jgi:uncharacterized protein GlcG (DUF336 family)